MKPFQYFECRPCLQPVDEKHGDTVSYTDEDQFRTAAANASANGVEFLTFWTIYGVTADGRATAIADDIAGKESAYETLAAMLAPMRAVLEILDSDRPYRIRDAAELVRGFIESCSTPDRI